MEYTHHLTAYSESAGLLDESAAETVLPSEEVNGSEPLPNNNDYNDALDPYASQSVYDAYAAQLKSDALSFDDKNDNTHSIKSALETTYASADPYFETGDGDKDDESSSSEPEEEDSIPTKSNPEPSSFAVKDWNEEFQQLLQYEDNFDKFVELGKLAQEFVYIAQTYGRVIISELSVPVNHKTIKPISIGGTAGGEKYIVNGILFKFALDFNGIYGGDENAAKAAGHDLKGSINFLLAGEQGLHLPLMALINYMGFCLISMSLLPISSKTLKYGSANSGVTVHIDDDELFNKMAETAKRLNLKGHFVGALPQSMRLIYGPGDLEGHLGTDGRYYVIDFARLFPPEAPIDGTTNTEKGRILYKLLRPELVATNNVPLSSDAYTGWSVLDKQHGPTNNKEVLDCTVRLLVEVIPKFAEDLKSRSTSDNQALFTNIPSELHRYGINVRYAGHVRRLVRESGWNETLLSFIISRTVSSIIRKKWRKVISTSKYITEQKCKEIAIEILNRTFISNTAGYTAFVNGKLRKNIKRKFKFAFFDDEDVDGFDYIQSCLKISANRVACFKNIAMQLGLEVNTVAEKSISTENTALIRRDIIAIHPRVKHMNVIDIAEAQEMLYSAIYGDGAKSHFQYITDYFSNTINNAPHLVKYQVEYILKASKTYRKRAKSGALQPLTFITNAHYLAVLFASLLEHERDDRMKFPLALERLKLYHLAVTLATAEEIDSAVKKSNLIYSVEKLVELNPGSPNVVGLYLDILVHCYYNDRADCVSYPVLTQIFQKAEENLKDDTKFQLITVQYLLFNLVFLNSDESQKIIELIQAIQKPASYLPKLFTTKKLAFLSYKWFEYQHFDQILKIAKEVPEFYKTLQQVVAIERNFVVPSINLDHATLLKDLLPANGFVSLKIKGAEDNLGIMLLSHYLPQSRDLTYLEMDNFPELPVLLIKDMQSNKKITTLKLSRFGPSSMIYETIKDLAPNLEVLTLATLDLTSEEFIKLLEVLPKGLRELKMSSNNITNQMLAAPEISELLNQVLVLDLTDCSSITNEAIAMLVTLKHLQRLVLIGCTGIIDQDFYASVLVVASTSLLRIVTRHGDVLEYQNKERRLINRQMTSFPFFAERGIITTYYWQGGLHSVGCKFTDGSNLAIQAAKINFEKSIKIQGHVYAVLRSVGPNTFLSVGKLKASINSTNVNIMLPGMTFYKQTNILKFTNGACVSLLLPIFLSLTQM